MSERKEELYQLAAQFKAGQISKEDMMERIQKLAKESKAARTGAPAQAPPANAPATAAASRQEVLQRILTKRQAEAAAEASNPPPAAALTEGVHIVVAQPPKVTQDPRPEPLPKAASPPRRPASARTATSTTTAASATTKPTAVAAPSVSTAEHAAGAERGEAAMFSERGAHDVSSYVAGIHTAAARPSTADATGRRARGQQAPRPPTAPASDVVTAAHPRGNTVPQPYQHGSAAPPMLSNRAERIMEEIREAEAKTLTFKPQINDAAAPLSEADFLLREQAWLARKRAHMSTVREAKAAAELDGCSFAPAINATSEALASRRASAADRMQASKEKRESKLAAIAASQAAHEQQACTFKPTINSGEGTAQIKPKYAQPVERKPRPETAAGTFRPMINAVRGDFAAANQYLAQPAWERLAKTRAMHGGAAAASEHDENSYAPVFQQQQAQQGQGATPGPAAAAGVGGGGGGGGRRMSTGSTPAPAAAAAAAAGANTPQRESFARFWERQQEMTRRRAQDVSQQREAEAAAVGHHQPRIAPASERILARSGRGDASFSERVEQSAKRRDMLSRSLLGSTGAAGDDGWGPTGVGFTFQPQISARARQRAARTADEMANGDRARRDAERVAVREQVLREELNGVTFQPALCKQSRGAESRLRLNSASDTYTDRMQQAELAREERAAEERLRRARSEADECTFKPEVHDAPDYVKRIASSRALAKTLRPTDEPSRPSWQ